MIALPTMLTGPAAEAGISVPDDPEHFDSRKYPHFAVFCNAQLGRSMPRATSHWMNAKIVAAIPMDKILEVTFDQLYTLGFE